MKVQKRNRITICVSFIRPIISGDGDSALSFAEALNKQGYTVSVVSLNPYAKFSFKSECKGIKVYRSNYFNRFIIGKILSRLLFIPIVTYKIIFSDIVMVYGRMLCYKYSLFAASLFGKKVIFRSTLLDFDDIATLTKGNTLEARLNRFLFGKVDFYFATTPVFAKRWKESGFVLSKIFESPQGVDITKFKPVFDDEKSRLRQQLNLPENVIVICSIGDLCYRKGYDDIASALEKVTMHYLYIVLGAKEPKKGLWGQKNNAKEIAEVKAVLESKLKEKINLVGLVSNPEDYLKASDIFLHFSKKEGLSNALQQAMACGLSVVAKPIEGVPNYILFNEVNCFFANNAQELEQQVNGLLLNNQLRANLGIEARNLAIKKLDVENVANKFIALLANLHNK